MQSAVKSTKQKMASHYLLPQLQLSLWNQHNSFSYFPLFPRSLAHHCKKAFVILTIAIVTRIATVDKK